MCRRSGAWQLAKMVMSWQAIPENQKPQYWRFSRQSNFS
jgi:hypothetical protein